MPGRGNRVGVQVFDGVVPVRESFLEKAGGEMIPAEGGWALKKHKKAGGGGGGKLLLRRDRALSLGG